VQPTFYTAREANTSICFSHNECTVCSSRQSTLDQSAACVPLGLGETPRSCLGCSSKTPCRLRSRLVQSVASTMARRRDCRTTCSNRATIASRFVGGPWPSPQVADSPRWRAAGDGQVAANPSPICLGARNAPHRRALPLEPAIVLACLPNVIVPNRSFCRQRALVASCLLQASPATSASPYRLGRHRSATTTLSSASPPPYRQPPYCSPTNLLRPYGGGAAARRGPADRPTKAPSSPVHAGTHRVLKSSDRSSGPPR